MKIRSLGFGDIRECVTLWRLISRSLGCNVSRMTEADEASLQENPSCDANSKREQTSKIFDLAIRREGIIICNGSSCQSNIKCQTPIGLFLIWGLKTNWKCSVNLHVINYFMFLCCTTSYRFVPNFKSLNLILVSNQLNK
jgi:hypothetical protein